MLAGALTLLGMVSLTRRDTPARGEGGWRSAFFLVLYAVAFSFAYMSLTAGTGALILFGCVQATMIASALRSGERPGPLAWIGLLVAMGGLVFLTAPGLSAPPLGGSVLMALAGVAWGVYTLRGRGTAQPLIATSRNFLRAVPFALAVSLILMSRCDLSARGAFLAIASGALASGVGYVLWYAALRGLSATRAATVQLSVPVIAALGGVLFLAETISPRLVGAGVLILGGVGLALADRARKSH
jgi:drug/metabolite transporter (DMT)-like permease